MDTPDRDAYLDAVLIGGREPRTIVIAEIVAAAAG